MSNILPPALQRDLVDAYFSEARPEFAANNCHVHTCRYCGGRWICPLDHSNGVHAGSATVCPDCQRIPWGELQRLRSAVRNERRGAA